MRDAFDDLRGLLFLSCADLDLSFGCWRAIRSPILLMSFSSCSGTQLAPVAARQKRAILDESPKISSVRRTWNNGLGKRLMAHSGRHRSSLAIGASGRFRST